MGWSGGEFTRVHDWTDDEAAGYNIEASRMDAEDDNFETGINACLHKGGQNTATANLPMGGYLHTGVGNGSARNHYAAIGQVQDGSFHYATAGGTPNVLTLTLSPAITAYAAGQTFIFKADSANTAAATLNVNSLGAKNIYYLGDALTGYEITADELFQVVYDGTQFQLLNAASKVGCVAYRSTDQAIVAGVPEAIEFTDEDADFVDSPIHSTSSNTSRFTVVRTGFYICTCYAEFDGDSDDDRQMYIAVDGVAKYTHQPQGTAAGATPVRFAMSGIVLAAAGEYIEFYVSNITDSENVAAARAGVHLLSF